MAQEKGNPLLSAQFRVPFDRITAADVVPAVAALLRDARSRLEAIVTPATPPETIQLPDELSAADPGDRGIFPATGERTYDDTMRALDELTEPLDYAMGVVRHLESVATYPELRAAFNAVQPDVSSFYTGIPLNGGLWQTVKSFAETLEAAELSGDRRRFLRKTMDTFRRHGADLSPEGKTRL